MDVSNVDFDPDCAVLFLLLDGGANAAQKPIESLHVPEKAPLSLAMFRIIHPQWP